MKTERSFADLENDPNAKAIDFIFNRLEQRYKQAIAAEEKVSKLIDSIEDHDKEAADKLNLDVASIIKDHMFEKMVLEQNAAVCMLRTTAAALRTAEKQEDKDKILNTIKQAANAIDLYLNASQKI